MTNGAVPPIEEIRENFEFLDDWESRFAYLIDLGKQIPPMPDEDRTEANLVRGCQAQVWLTAALDKHETPPLLRLGAVSDAHIVNGLIAIMLSLYNNKAPRDALSVDAEAVLAELGLDSHLSPTRRNGLHAMLERVRTLASAYSHASAAEKSS